jgi:NDP-sugar pyrophosphorylase family protein
MASDTQPASVPGTTTDARLAAVVLAAGEGKRLRPLTTAVPKPLLTVLDTPIIDPLLDVANSLGAETVFVNLFYQVRAMVKHLSNRLEAGLRWGTERTLSGPAGALRLFCDELQAYDAVVVLSGDLVVDDDLEKLVSTHLTRDADLTFAVTTTDRASRYGVLQITADGEVNRAREKPDVPDDEQHPISAGIYCIRPGIIRRFPDDRVYDFAADLVPDLLASEGRVHAYHLAGYWNDLGRPDSLYDANLVALDRWWSRAGREYHGLLPGGGRCEGPVFVGRGATVATGSVVRGPAVIGMGSKVGAGCWIERSVLLPDTVVRAGSVMIGGLAAPAMGTEVAEAR